MSKLPTEKQVSAGGVAFRHDGDMPEVALIRVRDRWQLPKGMVNRGESDEAAAQREVREETGIHTELLERIDTIEYWFYSTKRGNRVRLHKFVHFYLLRYLSGVTDDHDHEVDEARWVAIDQAEAMLTFDSERTILGKARALIFDKYTNNT